MATYGSGAIVSASGVPKRLRGATTLAFVERSDIAGDQRDDQTPIRQGQDARPGLQLVGLGGGEFAVESQHLFRTDALHPRRVDHQTSVANRLASDAVTAAPDRDEQVVLACKLHRRDNIGGAGATGDQRRPMVDHGVKDLARIVVARITGE